MITAIVTFKLPRPVTLEEARRTFLGTAPRYQSVEGLIRKYYMLSDDGGTVGGVYLWHARDQAEEMYSEEWREFVRGKYGCDPVVTYLATPVVVDNLTHQILTDE